MREEGELKRGDYVQARCLLPMKDQKSGGFLGKIEGIVVSLGLKSDGEERHFVVEYGAEGDKRMQIPVRYSRRFDFDVFEEVDDDEE